MHDETYDHYQNKDLRHGLTVSINNNSFENHEIARVPAYAETARKIINISGRYLGSVVFFGNSKSRKPITRPEINPPRWPPTDIEETVNVRTKLSNSTIPSPLFHMEYPLDR